MPRKFETLVELLRNSLDDFGEKEVFGEKQEDGSWKWLTYRDFGELVADARAGLAELGVMAGDRVAIVSNNRIEWAVFAFATFGLGAAYVPMYEAQHVEEWKFILADCGAKIVIGSTLPIYESLAKAQAELPELAAVIGLSLSVEDPHSYAGLLKIGRQATRPVAEVGSGDLAALIYTSGTTGNPKGVRLTHRNICSNVEAASQRFEFTTSDTSVAFLPWAHAFGQTAELYTLMAFGATMAINDEIPNLVSNLPVIRPTVLVAVPRIFNRIYDGVNKQMSDKPHVLRKLFHAGITAATKRGRNQPLSLGEKAALGLADRLIFTKIRQKFGGRLRFVVSGSAALSPKVAEFIDALGIEVFEGYGLTETSPVVSANYPGNRKIGSIGKPFPGVTVRIDRTAAADDKSGEIIVSGPNVMQGYHNRPEENEQIFCEDGALRTGDMGYVDEEGYLYITGRIKEQYKLENGKYVVPSPLEEQLKLSPFLLNVMLHGDNRPYNVALVVLDVTSLKDKADKEGWELGQVETNPKVRGLIASELEAQAIGFKSYERPKQFVLTLKDFTVENGQLTPSLKIKRRAILAEYGPRLDALYEA